MPSSPSTPGKVKRPRPAPVAILRGHTAPLTATQFLPFIDTDNDLHHRYLFTGDEIGNVRLWDTYFEETISTFRPTNSSSPILSILSNAHGHDSSKITIHQKNGRVTRFDLDHDIMNEDEKSSWNQSKMKSAVKRKVIEQSFCRMIQLSHSNQHLFAAPAAMDPETPINDDGSVVILHDDRIAGKNVNSSTPCLKSVTKLSISKRDNTGFVLSLSTVGKCEHLIATGYEGGGIALYDIRSPSTYLSFVESNPKKSAVLAMHSAPNGHVLTAAGAFDSITAIGDCNTKSDSNDSLNIIARAPLSIQGIADIKWSKNGKLIVSTGWDSKVRVWDGRRKENSLLNRIVSLRWHEGTASCIDISPDSKMIATGGKDTTIALWNGQI